MSFHRVIPFCAFVMASPAFGETDLSGLYAVDGRNPDGSAYSGALSLTHAGDTIAAHWTVGADSYRGSGTLENRIVTVDWGSTYPVIYVVMPDGSLHGTWDNGRALEKASPRN